MALDDLITKEQAIGLFALEELDLQSALAGNSTGFYDADNPLVKAIQNGDYSVMSWQEDKFHYLRREYNLSVTEMKSEILKYQLEVTKNEQK